MTGGTFYTRRKTLGIIAALPMATSCGPSLVRNGSGSAGANPSAIANARPAYHITAPPGEWINDPQRPVKTGDVWTLFALNNPTYPKGGTSWRRWTSDDLVAWQDQGIAIPRNTTPFGDVWSGSTVIDTHNTAGFGAGALITLVTMPARDAGGQNQSCALWYSLDNGASFAFHAIVLPNDPGHSDFRDPTVFWHVPTGRWVMTLSQEGKIGIYTSPDLHEWSYASGFASKIVGPIMECSHLFQLHLYDEAGAIVADRWILLVGGNGTKIGFTVGTYYWVGDFDGTTFTPSSPTGQWLDGGADYYAAVVWSDPLGADPLASAYSIGWMSNWDYVNEIPDTRGYSGQLSIVRNLRLQLDADVARLFSTPLATQNTVFDRTIAGQDQTLVAGSDYVWPDGSAATACRIDLTLTRFAKHWPAEVALQVRKGGGFATQITFAPRANRVSLDRENSGPNAPDIGAWRQTRSVTCDFSDGVVRVSLFVDTGSIEVFLNEGEATMSELFTAPMTATGLQLYVTDGSVRVSNVSIARIA